MTVLFGVLNVVQFVRDMLRGGVWRERERSLRAIKLGLVQLRTMLTEAGEKKEVIKTDAAQSLLHSIGHHVMSIEHHIDGMIEADKPKDR